MALVSLPHPPMIGFKENALEVHRFHANEWNIQAKKEDGSAVDFTTITTIEVSAYKERQVRGDRVHYEDEKLKLTLGNGIAIKTPPGTDGWLTVSIDRTKTTALAPGLYWWDLWYDDGTNRILLIDKAEFRVLE